MNTNLVNAEVIAVNPDSIKIAINNLDEFLGEHGGLKLGSFLNVSDDDSCQLVAVIQNFSLEVNEDGKKKYFIDALPLGTIQDGEFIRGGDTLSIPPTSVSPTKPEDMKVIFESSVNEQVKFIFSKLINHQSDIEIPVDGNKFFNKHIAVVGSTGSGKSHTISSLLQHVINSKDENYSGLNDSHIIIFDLHSEYKSAFPNANYLDISNLKLPYWLLNSSELEEILLDTGERDNYNQASIFRQLVTENKKVHNEDSEKIFYDSPLKFRIEEILNALFNIKNETVHSKTPNTYMLIENDQDQESESGLTMTNEEKIRKYFTERFKFKPTKSQSISKGAYADGTLEKFFLRFDSKVRDERLDFLFNSDNYNLTLIDVLKQILGYKDDNKSNITILDLSGIPFEVLSITVSLISRLLFDYGYFYKKAFQENTTTNNNTPFLLVYEEAHRKNS